MSSAKKRGQKRRFGSLVFFIPVIILIALVLFGLYQNAENSSGVLVVEAQSQYGSSSHFISATATVSGVVHKTPFNLTVSPGSHTVTYNALEWYRSPPPKTVTVIGGGTAYSVGVYVPTQVIVGVDQAGFNSTKVTSKGGITPVVWVNTGTLAVQLESTAFSVVLSQGQNYTRVFTGSGSLVVSLQGTNSSMTLNVT